MNERIAKILTHKATIPATIGVVSFGVGFTVGYIRSKRKRLPPHVVPMIGDIPEGWLPADGRIVDKPSTQRINPSLAYPDLLDDDRLVEKDKDGSKKFGLVLPAEPEEEENLSESEKDPGETHDVIRKNVFAKSSTDVWNYEDELKNRTSLADGVPYILHQDEFFQNERDWNQETLTYFVGDDIMVDQDDQVMYNHAQKIGELRFGHGSNDPNVFYVRCPKYRTEYEVLRHEGYYSVEVQGLSLEEAAEEDLKHSVEKFRD